MVLSVSKTYIKLKDLILEKKFLQKETHKLKNLNSHLEHRLGQQEKRLGAVTIELNKTWTLVGRMQVSLILTKKTFKHYLVCKLNYIFPV